MKQFFIFFALIFLPNFAFGEEPLKLVSPVTDLAHILTEQQNSDLLNQIASFEKERGSQLVVLTVNNLGQYAIEEFAYKVFQLTQIGRSKTNDGILLLISVQDRKARIEVGRGLEGAVPDAYAKRIIEGVIKPNFREQKYYSGISECLKTLSYLIEKEELPPNLASSPTSTEGFNPVQFGFIVFIIVSILGEFLVSIFGKNGAPIFSSAVTLFVVSILFSVLLGAFSSILVYLLLRILPFGDPRYRILGSNTWNTSGMGGFGGGGGSSWSGGGGSSGGGGASGSW